MGKQHQALLSAGTGLKFYRATPMALAVDKRCCPHLRCAYQLDVLEICERGIWEHELRQFMPPASLQAALDSLLELGLIEQVESPSPRAKVLAFEHRRINSPTRRHA